MEQWEYKTKIIFIDENPNSPHGFVPWTQQIDNQLNEMGELGWEVVCFPSEILKNSTEGFVLFKRRKNKE